MKHTVDRSFGSIKPAWDLLGNTVSNVKEEIFNKRPKMILIIYVCQCKGISPLNKDESEISQSDGWVLLYLFGLSVLF